MNTEEELVWEGRPAWVEYFWVYVSCILLIPIPYAIWVYIKNRCYKYELSTERLHISEGVFNKQHDEIELYRVKDTVLHEPFLERLNGCGTLELVTSDAKTPIVMLRAIPDAKRVRELIRQHVERLRQKKGVKELDIE